jgi:hypothetical protein
MKDVPVDQKKEVGAKLNDVRTAVTDGIESKKLALQAAKDAKASPDGPRGHHGHGKGRGDHGKRGGADAKPVSLTEFSARGLEAFTRADANKDGTVTITELQAMKPGKL